MYIAQLSLTNFRNYSRLSRDLSTGITVLQGRNAQGKTNFLEAIHYLTSARSPYASSDSQLVHWLAEHDDLPHARIVAELVKQDARIKIEITLLRNGGGRAGYRKHIRINGLPKRAMDLMGLVNVVFFVPQDISLVDGSPSGRRRYLDNMLCQVDPEYYRALREYNRILEQRNALLRSLRERRGTSNELDVWNDQLLPQGALLIARRQQAIVDLEWLAQPVHRALSGDREQLRMRYLPSFDPHRPLEQRQQMGLNLDMTPPISLPLPEKEIHKAFARMLDLVRREDIQRGVTTIGPHRDDFHLFDSRVDLHVYGSRGQQRTAVLALKLAEVEWMARATGEQPILLLDDVLSELDIERRRFLCEQLGIVEQALITTTDLQDLENTLLSKAIVYRVSQGHLSNGAADGR